MAKENGLVKANQSKEVAAETLVNNDLMSSAFAAGMTGDANLDRDCITVPYLRIAQTLTPQVNKNKEGYIDGLNVGDFFSTVTNKVFGDTIKIIVLDFNRVYTMWEKSDDNQGNFKGSLSVAEMQTLIDNKNVNVDGVKITDVDTVYTDTRNFFVFLPDFPEEGILVFSLKSTGIRHSKNICTLLNGMRIKDPKTGQAIKPPFVMSILEIKTAYNENGKNNWYTVGSGKTTLVKHVRYINDADTDLIAALKDAILKVKDLAEMSTKFDYDNSGNAEPVDSGAEM